MPLRIKTKVPLRVIDPGIDLLKRGRGGEKGGEGRGREGRMTRTGGGGGGRGKRLKTRKVSDMKGGDKW